MSEDRDFKRKRITSGTQTEVTEVIKDNTVSSINMAENMNKNTNVSTEISATSGDMGENTDTKKILDAILDMQKTLSGIYSKLDNNTTRIDTLHKDIHDPTGGIEHRLQCLTEECEYTHTSITQIQQQHKTMKSEMSAMKGYIIKLEEKVISQQNQITDLVGRGMRENLIINGLPEEEGENLKRKMIDLFEQTLEIKDQNIKIDRVHRFGQKNKSHPRPIVAKFHDYCQRELVLELARQKKSEIGSVRISPHYPDEVREKRKQLYEMKKSYDQEKIETKIRGDKLIFTANGSIFKEKVPVPKASAILDFSDSKFKFNDYSESIPINERGNEFVGRATTVKRYNETREAVRQIIQKPETISATHNMYAYRFKDNTGKIHQGFQDDGEAGSGAKLLKMMTDSNFIDALVVVSRFVGEKLGPLRFTCITRAGNEALANLG